MSDKLNEVDILTTNSSIEVYGTAEERASLFKKLSKVNSSVKRIKHTGYFDGGYSGKYTYATEADVVEPIASALAKQSVALIPGIEGVMWHDMPLKSGYQRLCTVMATMIIGDGDTGAYIRTSTSSTAANKDKATNSAFTTATKYFMAKLGNVAFGDDADEYTEDGKKVGASTSSAKKAKPTKKQRDDLSEQIISLGKQEEVKEYMKNNSITWASITKEQYDHIVGIIK